MALTAFPSHVNALAAQRLDALFTALSALDCPTHCTLSCETEPLAAYSARQWVKAHADEWYLDVWPTAHGEAMCVVSRTHGFAIVHVYGASAGDIAMAVRK